jgi:hypothetical protein
MIRIPHRSEVNHAIRALRTAAKESARELNRLASAKLARGDYSAAEELTTYGKRIKQFEESAAVLSDHWRQLSGKVGQGQKVSVTPLWQFFRPALQAVIECGGECSFKEVESHVEPLLTPVLQPADHKLVAGRRERWKVRLQRAKKPMIAEGWLEGRSGSWKITEAGRRAAANSASDTVGTRAALSRG